MRFVSKSASYHAGNYRNAELAVSEPKVVIIDGVSRVTQSEPYTVSKSLPIQFSQAGLLQSDIEAALSQWTRWPGLPQEEDGVTPANPVDNGRIGVWDSVEWQAEHGLTDEDREGAEKLLLGSVFYGTDFIQVAEPVELVPQKPWPNYDETHHFKIASLAAELGLTEAALAYELANKNRKGVIEALTGEKNEKAQAEVVDDEVIPA